MTILRILFLLRKNYRRNNTALALCPVLLMIVSLTACSKNNTAPQSGAGGGTGPDTDTTVTEVPGLFYKLIHVSNLPGDTSSAIKDSSAGAAPVSGTTCLFSLEANTARNIIYKQTNKWDLAFDGISNSFLSGNNGANARNYGLGSNAVGGIYIVKQPFDSVTNIPADALFQTGPDVYGTDDSGAFGTGVGWYFYDFTGGSFPGGDGQPHICYAIPDRTVIVRTATGNYAKIKMISIYKDAPTAPTTFWPQPYFTFDYVLAPKGSTSFVIK